MKLLTYTDAGLHKVDDTILNKLQQKHPQPVPLTSDRLLNGPVNRPGSVNGLALILR